MVQERTWLGKEVSWTENKREEEAPACNDRQGRVDAGADIRLEGKGKRLIFFCYCYDSCVAKTIQLGKSPGKKQVNLIE